MFSKIDKSSSATRTAPATGARQIPFSLIGGDIVISGNVTASADLHIDGRVDGDIACAALVQGPDSRITGQVVAKSARIGGHVEGSITADDLVVEATARITGDVTYQTVSIAPGAQVSGRFAVKGTGADLKLIETRAG